MKGSLKSILMTSEGKGAPTALRYQENLKNTP